MKIFKFKKILIRNKIPLTLLINLLNHKIINNYFLKIKLFLKTHQLNSKLKILN